MPVYEFHCETCEHDFEELVRASGKARVACPKCGKDRVSRRISVFATRGSAAEKPAGGATGGCGRCGDPNGPCGL